MPVTIGRDELLGLLEDDAQVAEVLPRDDYDWAHLPAAIHLPLKQFSAEVATSQLNRARPVVVYCHDYQ